VWLGGVFVVTDAGGDARVPFVLPEAASGFDFEAQWLVLAGSDDLRASAGVHVQVR
jgi:hypothetical protein